MAESMVFYKSFYDAINELPEENRYEILKAIIEYGLLGVEPKLMGIPNAVFLLIKPQIDANNKRRENGKYGVLGGRPKKPIENPKKPIGLSVIKPNGLSKKNPNVNVNVNENVNNTSSSSCACAREENTDDFDSLLESYDEYRKRQKQKQAEAGRG